MLVTYKSHGRTYLIITKISGNTDRSLVLAINFSVHHLNLSSTPGHNFIKISFVHFHS